MPSALTIIASVAMKGWRPSLDDEGAVDRSEHQRKARRHQENRQDAEFRRNLRGGERGDRGAGREAEKRRNAIAAPGAQHDLPPPSRVDVAPAREPVEHEPRQEADRQAQWRSSRPARP